MKYIQICFVFFLVVQNRIQGAELSANDRNQIALECIRQTGIARSVVEQAKTGNIPKNDTKYKDFLSCSYKKQGFQSENGEVLIDGVKKFLQKFYSLEDLVVLDACAGYKGPNHGENALNALQCILLHIRNIPVVNKTT